MLCASILPHLYRIKCEDNSVSDFTGFPICKCLKEAAVEKDWMQDLPSGLYQMDNIEGTLVRSSCNCGQSQAAIWTCQSGSALAAVALLTLTIVASAGRKHTHDCLTHELHSRFLGALGTAHRFDWALIAGALMQVSHV